MEKQFKAEQKPTPLKEKGLTIPEPKGGNRSRGLTMPNPPPPPPKKK